jgi:hypothetical protein
MNSNPRCREAFYGRNSAPVWRTIRPDKKHLCRENLFAWDSALLRVSPIRFVRRVEGECSAMIRASAAGFAASCLFVKRYPTA